MAQTLSTLSVGIVGDVDGFRQPVERAIGVAENFASTLTSTLTPAAKTLSQTSEELGSQRSLGILPEILEMLSLRTMATSQAVSGLAHHMKRLASQNDAFRKGIRGRVEGLTEEESAYRQLAATQRNVMSQIRDDRTHQVRLELIDENAELGTIARLKSRLGDLKKTQFVERSVERVNVIDRELSDLQERREPLAKSSNAADIVRRRELDSEINALLSERLRLSMQIKSMDTGEESGARSLRQIEEEINRTLEARQRQLLDHRRAHQENLKSIQAQREALKQRTATDPSQIEVQAPSLSDLQQEFSTVEAKIREAERSEERLIRKIKSGTLSEEQTAQAVSEANEHRKTAESLREKAVGVSRDMLETEKRGLKTAADVRRELEFREASQTRSGRLRFQAREEERRFTEQLKEAVRTQQLSTAEADELLKRYRQLADADIRKANQGIEQSQARLSGMRNQMTQLGYATQDLISGFGTNGVAGAVQGVSNNLAVMASSIQSLRLNIAANVGVTLLQLAASTGLLDKALDSLGIGEVELSETNEDLAKSFDLVSDAQKRFLDSSREMRDIRASDLGGLKSRFEKLTAAIEDARISRRQLQSEVERERLQAEAERLETRISEGGPGTEFVVKEHAKAIEKINALNSGLTESERKLQDLRARNAIRSRQQRETVLRSEQATAEKILELDKQREQKRSGPRKTVQIESELAKLARQREYLERQIAKTKFAVELRGSGEVSLSRQLIEHRGSLIELVERQGKLESELITRRREEEKKLRDDRKNELQDRESELKKRRKELQELLRQRSAPKLADSIEAGSVEAQRVILQSQVDSTTAEANKPIVDELQQVREELAEVAKAVRDIPVLNLKEAGN